MLGLGALGSQMERVHLPGAGQVYYIKLHREVRLLHTAEQEAEPHIQIDK